MTAQKTPTNDVLRDSRQGVVVEQGDDKYKTQDTEVSYYYRGAQFAMPQMRVPNEGRIEDVWINYKSGEWQGTYKGPNIKSYEFEENILEEGRKRTS